MVVVEGALVTHEGVEVLALLVYRFVVVARAAEELLFLAFLEFLLFEF